MRARRELDTARYLVDLWRRGDWGSIAHLSPSQIVHGSGLADARYLLEMLRDGVKPNQHPDPAAIELRVVVTALRGIEGDIGTTFEHVLSFRDADFDSEQTLECMFNAAVASGAFPALFAPVEIPHIGPCLDGGVVNNTPISYALSDGQEDETIIVVAPTPESLPASTEPLTGLDLLSRLTEAMTNERLYRDLRRAERINEALTVLDELAEARGWSTGDLEAVKSATGLGRKKRVRLVQIRPLELLAGNAFSGFSDADVREGYLQAGKERATAVLDDINLTQ